MSLALRERIYEIYKTFSEGDFNRLGDMFDENVDFISNAPIEIFPYLGRRIGRAEVIKALSAVHSEFEAIEYLPLRILVEDQTAGLIVSINLTQRKTKRIMRFFSANFLRFRDNRIVEYRAFLDSFEAAQQVLGREFNVTK